MAKRNEVAPRDDKYEDWNVDSAMRTMLRAREIVGDKKMMGLVKKRAAAHAKEMSAVASQADSLAKRGLISDKQMSKLKSKGQGGKVKDLDKKTPVASGDEGDRPSTNTRGISHH